jgi:cobalamin-dependent methionine synthase I
MFSFRGNDTVREAMHSVLLSCDSKRTMGIVNPEMLFMTKFQRFVRTR